MRFRKPLPGAVVSFALAAAAFAAAAGFGVFELRSRLYMNELLARNDGERTINLLLSVSRSLRDKDGPPPAPKLGGPDTAEEATEFAAVVASHAVLRARVAGIAAYGTDGALLFRYGAAPDERPVFKDKQAEGDKPSRSYSFDARAGLVRVVQPFPVFRPGSKSEGPVNGYIYYSLREIALFGRNAVSRVVFIVWLIASLAAVLIVARTLRRNAAYREELSANRELVALGSAARTLAHEIKNPLSAISLQADLIARLGAGIVDREAAVITQETARIRLLVDRIGDFLREPRGTPETVDLGEFARKLLEHASPSGRSAPVSAEDEGVRAAVDPARFRSVLENVVRNAYDAGGPEEEVVVRVFLSQGRAVVEVLDRGSGFPDAADTERCFDPFFTTKTRGFGLGLALSRRFVEAAGGVLSLSNREGGGASVRIELPRVKA